jgi:hypothetical protein
VRCASLKTTNAPLFLTTVHQDLFSADFVAFEGDGANFFVQLNADELALLVGGTGVADDVVFEDEIARFAADLDGWRRFGCAVVFNDVFFDAIAVAGHAFGFIAEMNAGLLIAADLVFAEKIVGIFVADGNSEAAVVFEDVVFENAVFDAPAEEQAVFFVILGEAAADGRALGAAAGMQTEAGVSFAGAVGHSDVVALLETDAVAIVVADGAARDDRARAAIEKNSSAATSVEVDVLVFVAVDGQIFDARVFEMVAAHDGENGGGLRAVIDHAVGV